MKNPTLAEIAAAGKVLSQSRDTTKATAASVERRGKEAAPPPGMHPATQLFNRIQASQGFAHISDGLVELPLEQAIDVVKNTALPNAKMAVSIIKKWLKQQGVAI